MSSKQFKETLAHKIHNMFPQYDLSKIHDRIKSQKEKIIVICPKHGEFTTTADRILHGHECNKCSYEKRAEKNALKREDVIKRSIYVHGNEYDYSEVPNIVRSGMKMPIICKKHGIFMQTPYHHINRGQGCPKCGAINNKRKMSSEHFFINVNEKYKNIFDFSNTEFKGSANDVTFKCLKCEKEITTSAKRLLYDNYRCKDCCSYKKENWLKICKELHGDNYDYSLSNYDRSNRKVEIIHKMCGTHFFMTPNNHTNRSKPQGCPICYGSRRKTTSEFIRESEEIFGKGSIIYTKTRYVNAHTDVIMTCPKHGDFNMTPNRHLSAKAKCPKCSFERRSIGKRLSEQVFYERCKNKFGDKFTYVGGNYNGLEKQFKFICEKHGEQEKRALSHLNSQCGCNVCAKEKLKSAKTSIQLLVEKIHSEYGDRYSFNPQDFTKMKEPMKFTCKLHGDFYVSPNNLLRGCKCRKCQVKYSLESEVKNMLDKLGETYVPQYRSKWLGRLSLDFYLPKCNVAIECQGRQHYEKVNDFGGDSAFNAQMERDARKTKKCEENGIKLLFFTHYPFENGLPHYTFNSIDELFTYITSSKDENIVK